MKSAIIVAIHCFDRHAQVRNSLKILSGLGQIVKESFVNVGALVIFARGGVLQEFLGGDVPLGLWNP